MCREEGRTPYYTPSTHRYGPQNEDNRDRRKYDMGYDTLRVVTLKYDGISNWQAFCAKFSRYTEVSGWSTHECRDQLCWCLEGKASEYYTLIVERNRNVEYGDLVRKIEKCFGFKELPETAQVQFQNDRQALEESQEDWTVRVLSLPTKAFRDFPDEHMYQQAILRVCQGAADKEAGSYASNVRPQTMGDAVNKIRWYLHNHQAIYWRGHCKNVRLVGAESTMDEMGSSPGRVNFSPLAQWRIPSQLQSDLCSLEDRVGALDKKWDTKFDKCVSQIEQITTHMSK